MQSNHTTFANEILRITSLNLENNSKFLVAGLGVNDPKGVFGTTLGLSGRYGESRVIETPTSENAITGIGVGLAISGFSPLLIHQRMDFFLLALDQLVNSAAKWHYMFGEQSSVPITIRLITGRGWGQGPTHSQNLHAWFAHIPGLKVVMPALASDVGDLLQAAIDDPNPVVFIEDRWLHGQRIELSTNAKLDRKKIAIGQAEVLIAGTAVTVVAAGYMVIESLKAVNFLNSRGLSIELIDLKSVKPLDENLILRSVRKTGRLVSVDSGHVSGSFGNQIIQIVATTISNPLLSPPILLGLPDVPTPTSHGPMHEYQVTSFKIGLAILNSLGLKEYEDMRECLRDKFVDAPDENFLGPF